jgi:Glycerol kinase
MGKFIVALDQGTTSSRAILFNKAGKLIYSSQKEFTQYFPKDGWVEHDPNDIWRTTKKVLKDVVYKANQLKGEILTIGIANQRETTVLWNKKSGKKIYNAIVWQDRRTAEFCKKIKTKKKEKLIKKKTGLLIDPYFSSTKIKWIFDNVPKAKKLAKKNLLAFGTIDTFLIWKLTGGKVHATDATNACRTMLFNISTSKWDKEILKIFNIPFNILPEIKNSSDNFGFTLKSITGKSIPIKWSLLEINKLQL